MRKVVFSNGIPLRERGMFFTWRERRWRALVAALPLVICFSDVSLEFRSVQFRHFIIPDGRLDLQSGAQDKKQTTQITRINTRVQNKDQYVSALTLLVSDLSWCNLWEGGFLKRPRDGSSVPNQLPSGILLYLSDDLCLNLVVEQTVRHTERHLALRWEHHPSHAHLPKRVKGCHGLGFWFCDFPFYDESISSCVMFHFPLPPFVCFTALFLYAPVAH